MTSFLKMLLRKQFGISVLSILAVTSEEQYIGSKTSWLLNNNE